VVGATTAKFVLHTEHEIQFAEWRMNKYTYNYVYNFSCLFFYMSCLTLILVTWRIWWAPNNASRWQMGINTAFKGLVQNILIITGKIYKKCTSEPRLWCCRC
jgi:hypothetical protein